MCATCAHSVSLILISFCEFGTRGSEVQILSPRPFFIFGPLEDQVEGLSVTGIKIYRVDGAVQKHQAEQLGLFRWIPRKVQRIGLVRSSKIHFADRRRSVEGSWLALIAI